MIGIGFIVRLLGVLFFLGVAVGLIILVSWVGRLLWEAFEANYREQAEWLKSKLPKISFKRKRRRKKKCENAS